MGGHVNNTQSAACEIVNMSKAETNTDDTSACGELILPVNTSDAASMEKAVPISEIQVSNETLDFYVREADNWDNFIEVPEPALRTVVDNCDTDVNNNANLNSNEILQELVQQV